MRRALFCLAVLAAAGCRSTGRRGELAVSVYGGVSHTARADLRLERPSVDTDLAIRNVHFHSEDFVPAPLYGIRFTYWLPQSNTWGLALDFVHPKAIADTRQVTRLHGTSNGVPVNETGAIRPHLQAFELSHGHNMLTFNVLRRWFPDGERHTRSWRGRIQPYVGLGAGLALPQAENTVDDLPSSKLQVAGPVGQALAGANYDLNQGFSVFGEFRIAFADLDVNAASDATIELQTWTSMFLFGVTYRF